MAYTGSIAPVVAGAKSPGVGGYAGGQHGTVDARQGPGQNGQGGGQKSFYDMFCATLNGEHSELQGMLRKVEENNRAMKETIRSLDGRQPAFAAPTAFEWGLARRCLIETPAIEVPAPDESGG